jgi:hypothetical protein
MSDSGCDSTVSRFKETIDKRLLDAIMESAAYRTMHVPWKFRDTIPEVTTNITLEKKNTLK